MEVTKITFDLVKLGILSGYLLIIFGLLSLFFPKTLIKLNNWANKLLVTWDNTAFSHRIILGIVSFLLGFFILFTIYKFLG